MNILLLEEETLAFEGLSLKVYVCPAGELTVGVGHRVLPTDNLKPDDRISLRQAGEFLHNDLSIAIRDAQELFGRAFFDSLSEKRQHALIDLLFNLGKTRFSKFARTIDAIKKHDWKRAHDELLNSKYATQVGRRAKRNALCLLEG